MELSVVPVIKPAWQSIRAKKQEKTEMKTLSNLVLVVFCMAISASIAWQIASKPDVGSTPIAAAIAASPDDQSSKVKSSEQAGANESIKIAIQQRFSQSRPDLVVSRVEPSPISGLYSVSIKNGPLLYVTADGGYFVMGDLFQAMPGGFVNIAEQAREGDRAKALAGVNVADMIVFAPEQQPSKAVINVFTDVDCYYCQKLHNEVPDLNRAGIEVRYLAYPRAGIGSESYKKIVSAWCSSNQQEAMTKLKRRQNIEQNICDENPVQKQFALGQQIGVSGTPALVTSTGRLMPGYMPTLQLAKALDVEVAPELTAELMQKAAAQPKR